MTRVRRWLMVLVLLPCAAAAQEFGFNPPPDVNDVIAPSVMKDLAERIVPVYQEADAEIYLSNLAALQLVTGNYTAAYDTAQTLRDRHQNVDADRPVERAVLYEIYAHARAIEAVEKIPFPQAFQRSFREVVPQLDSADAAAVMARLETPLPVFAAAVQKAIEKLGKSDEIDLPDALDLLRKFLSFEAHRSFGPFVAALDAEEDKRRYLVEGDIGIKVRGRGKAVIEAVVVRPSGSGQLPALLRFALDPSQDEAKLSAAHGYVGVVAYVRGRKGNGHGTVTPFAHDAEDVRAVIEWIAKQPWSDGRVGMIGEGYSGYAAWAAAKRAPPALKAIATSVPMAPGISFPMVGQINDNSALRWIADRTAADPTIMTGSEELKWRALDQIAYHDGGRYRDIDRVFFGRRNPLLRTWLTHPSYDRWWRKHNPTDKQFAQIGIPVLTMGGWYGADAGALYYFDTQLRHDPKADHTLLLGPYTPDAVEHGLSPLLRGLAPDPTALVDLRELRYQWFDHILKHAPKPPLLSDRVNVQLPGTNTWRHAKTLDALAGKPQRFYLDTATASGTAKLLDAAPAADTERELSVDLADRSDAFAVRDNALVSKTLPADNAIVFASEPLKAPLDLVGALRGVLDFVPNTLDVDLRLTLYEQRADGEYVQLSSPWLLRASYAGDRSRRRLLQAGVRQQLPIQSPGPTIRRLAAGSRLVLVLGVSKQPGVQLDYGTGKAVSDESIRDARVPLRLRLHSGSYVELPVRR